MFYIKNYLVLCMLTLFVGCTHNNINLNHLLAPNNFILIETAVDSSIESSRNKALNLLSQDIFVEIRSSFSQKEILNNNLYNTKSINEINSISNGYFKDITFSKTEYIGKEKYKTSVGLTQEAIINTINYLNNNLKASSVNFLDKTILEEEYNKTQFLIALVLFAKSKNIQLHNIDLKKLILYKEEINLRLSNAVQVLVNILPNLNKVAQINIIDKEYSASDNIFLTPGIYYYTVYAKGYKTITNKLEILSSQDKVYIDIYLQKLLSKAINTKLNITSEQPNLLKDSTIVQIKHIVEKYQFSINNYAKYTIKIEFLKPISSIINNYYYNNLPINITIYNGNTVKLSQIFKIVYITSGENTNISANMLLSKLDIFFAELTAGDNLYNLYK